MLLRSLALVVCACVSLTGAKAERIFATTTDGSLISFQSGTPGLVASSVDISGLQVGERLVGIDFRPANRALYGVGSSNQLYRINANTGVATAIGGPLNIALDGMFFGVDFNPRADLLRVISNTGQNLRIDPLTGQVRTNVSPNGDTMLAYAPGDPNAGTPVWAVATAYNNNFNSMPTTQYVIDANLDVLTIQNPPNTGQQFTQGPLNVNFSTIAGFDISGVTGTGYTSSGNALWTVNLLSGQASLAGSIAAGRGFDITDLSVSQVPEPGTYALVGLGLVAAAVYRRRRA